MTFNDSIKMTADDIMKADPRKIRFRVSRYRPGIIDPPVFRTYRLAVDVHMTVLDCIEKIRLEQEPTLMYRHSCHHSACGTCACRIDGSERLACTTNVWELGLREVSVEPLRGFRRIADLVVDTTPFYRHIGEDWSHLQSLPAPAGESDPTPRRQITRFESCIECGCCVSACPPARGTPEFMGPAALAAIHAEIRKSPQKKEALLCLAGGPSGERHCRRHLACSRVCPTAAYPARRIADLRKMTAP